MASDYRGPVRDEPLAVELYNTVYAVRGKTFDGLETADGLRSWLAAIAPRLPEPAREADPSRLGEFLELRAAVREVLNAAVDGRPIPPRELEVVNLAAARAPTSPVAVLSSNGQLRAGTHYDRGDATDVALAALAANAIDVLTGDVRDGLRACRAPGCMLMFRQDHPRRRWCSAACGNRARQARHYERGRLSRSS